MLTSKAASPSVFSLLGPPSKRPCNLRRSRYSSFSAFFFLSVAFLACKLDFVLLVSLGQPACFPSIVIRVFPFACLLSPLTVSALIGSQEEWPKVWCSQVSAFACVLLSCLWQGKLRLYSGSVSEPVYFFFSLIYFCLEKNI